MTDVQNVPDKQVYQGVVQFLVQVSVFMPVRPTFFASPVLSAVRVAEVAGLPVRLALEKPGVFLILGIIPVSFPLPLL